MLRGIMNYFLRFKRSLGYFLTDYHLGYGPANEQAYHLDSPDLWGISPYSQTERMYFKDGILHFSYPEIGIRANPAYIAWYGLICWNRWLVEHDPQYLDKALKHAQWLKYNAIFWKGALRWEYDFKVKSAGTVILPPWPSAIAQGLAISLLIRVSAEKKDENMRQIAYSAVKLYEIPIEDGGISTRLNNNLYFEEYPAYPLTLILDGTLFSLLGLYDMADESSLAGKLFEEGVEGLDTNWSIWDWHGVWSNYGCTGYLSTVFYHRLNCLLVELFQKKGYLKKFPLRGWKNGLKIKQLVALFHMKRVITANLSDKKCAA